MMSPARLGNYELGALIGSGGEGQVHAARDHNGRSVVVKRLRDAVGPDLGMRNRLADEARVCGRVSHPNVIRILDHDRDADGSPFLVMDHARGITAGQLVDAHGPLPIARVRVLARQLFDGLTAIHTAGIIHADLSSHNLIIDDDDHLTIIDFGLARTAMSQANAGGLVAGTPEFMALELFGGADPTIGSDIYAVGMILYEMLVGSTPFRRASPKQILHLQMTDSVTFPSVIGADLEYVLRRALHRDVAGRFVDVRELAAAFAEATEPDDPTVHRWRQQLLDALANPPTHPIIVAYSGLADALISAGRMPSAIRELESALVILVPPTRLPPPALWRLTLLLAAMYGRLGTLEHARALALDAHDQANRAADRDGIERARTLLRRLAGPHGTIDSHARSFAGQVNEQSLLTE